MFFNFNDVIGFTGVLLLLVAYLLNLFDKISKEGLVYLLLNIAGAALSGLASWLIHYVPFMILEGTWTAVSATALARYWLRNRGKPGPEKVGT